VKTGDLQSPEGFYSVTPGQMNPNSAYHLSFNLGYPNAFDRAHGRSGSFLMVHGACKSVGCYAMTDQQITEIYALANDAFSGGQAAFQVQAYPFRMTANNLARHRDSPHMAFWQNLKEGSDHFEVTNQPPQVAVCEKRYVFGTTTAGCQSPAGPQSLMARISAKRKADEKAVAALVNKGTAGTPLINYTDGGMHPSFARVFARQ
jgi:murein L,D-transpeptidase YafK